MAAALSLKDLARMGQNFTDSEKEAYFEALLAIAERIERLAIAVEQQVKPEMPMMEKLFDYPVSNAAVTSDGS